MRHLETLVPSALKINVSNEKYGTNNADITLAQHYTVFPLALGQILREYGVSELHLTLNAGNWNYDRWGYPEEKGVGTGAELWAWLGDGAPTR